MSQNKNTHSEIIKDNLRAFIVPIDIFDVPDLTIHDQMVYVVLRSFCNPRSQNAFPSYATIAEAGRMSRDSAMRSVQKLIEKKLIMKETKLEVSPNRKVQNSSNVYTFLSINTVNNDAGVVAVSDQGSSCERLGVVAVSDQGSGSQQPYYLNTLKYFKRFKDFEEEEEENIPASIQQTIEKYKKSGQLSAKVLDKLIQSVDFENVPVELLDYVLKKAIKQMKNGQIVHLGNWLIGAIENEMQKTEMTGNIGNSKKQKTKFDKATTKKRPQVNIISNDDAADEISQQRLDEIRKKAREYDSKHSRPIK